MTQLLKTKAIVLRKIDYGDSSRIIHLFTEDFGKISAMLKGARSSKSNKGLAVDMLNYVQIIIYQKETRELQFISDVDLINHFPVIKDDYDRIKYAMSIIELLLNLTVENEHHHNMFIGSVRALELLNMKLNRPKLIFAKYFLFFLKEIGYELQFKKCSVCGESFEKVMPVSFNYGSGVICSNCAKDKFQDYEIKKELFNLFLCLSSKKNDIQYDEVNLDSAISLMDKFLKYNVSEYKGLKSLMN